MEKVKIGIIGGGATGLFVGAMLNDINAEITIFDKNNKVGKKILASGNGKCNFTNIESLKDKYNDVFANKIVESFTVEDTLKEFNKMGLIYKSDNQGRCYPVSECASSVLDCLKSKLNRVHFKLECAVTNVESKRNKWCVYYNDECDYFDYIVCCSGSSASNLGSDKAYEYLKVLKLNFTNMTPSLVPVIVKEKVKVLSGVRVKCLVTLLNSRNAIVYSENGEVIFKDNGLSGIAVFNASSYINRNKNDKYRISLDISSNLTDKELFEYFKNKEKRNLFKGIFNDKIGEYLLDKLNLNNKNKLNDSDIYRIVNTIKNLEFNIIDFYSFKDCQVCSGGIKIDEVNENLQLLKYPQIYVGGELLDIDGVCGGYNLQFAWSSGGVIARDIRRTISCKSKK